MNYYPFPRQQPVADVPTAAHFTQAQPYVTQPLHFPHHAPPPHHVPRPACAATGVPTVSRAARVASKSGRAASLASPAAPASMSRDVELATPSPPVRKPKAAHKAGAGTQEAAAAAPRRVGRRSEPEAPFSEGWRAASRAAQVERLGDDERRRQLYGVHAAEVRSLEARLNRTFDSITRTRCPVAWPVAI